jgi:hypothetical protein
MSPRYGQRDKVVAEAWLLINATDFVPYHILEKSYEGLPTMTD